MNYTNWQIEHGADEIVELTIDRAGQSTNTLSRSVLEEFETIVEALRRSQPRGLIIQSGKESGFIAGADIAEFKTWNDPAVIAASVSQVHETLNKLERCRFPVVAKIEGFCLGGGLEIALACRYRVGCDDDKTRLGLPEILLGIHPGFAGTVRSIERIGVIKAMDMMLTGRTINARTAKKLGLIDRAVPKRYLDRAARALIIDPPRQRKLPIMQRVADNTLTRPLVAKILRRQVAKRASEQHYPAPYALIRLWQSFGGNREDMMAAEAQSISRLLISPSSRNLQRLFFLQERLKGFGRGGEFRPRHVHVIGAGTMGGDIAAWCASRGLHVTLEDREIQYVAPAIARAHKRFNKRIRDRYRRLQTRDNLVIDLAGDGVARADVVIEAIVEDLEAKQTVFRNIEQRARPDALLATNTSSIPLEDIAAAMTDQSRLVGVHFFNPVQRMQLVEVIAGKQTSERAIAHANAFTVQIDRQPLPANSSPGFLINRILSPYLQEAMLMLDEGISGEEIDQIACDFGMPMGPIELADTVGLDICLSVGQVLSSKLGGDSPAILQKMVSGGRLGRKTNAGFYQYKGAKIIRPKRGESMTIKNDVRDRMILRLLNEAVACLRERVVEDADLIDVGMVFGTGFAPFRGGPLSYARARGVDEIVRRLNEFSGKIGDRFTPDPGWTEIR